MGWETFVAQAPLLLAGALNTALLTLLTLLCGAAIAAPVAACRLSTRRSAQVFALAFVFFFRGAPLLVLLYLIYYGLPEWPVVRETPLWLAFRDPWFCAVLGLSLNSAGYLAEVMAGALRAVPKGEVEAAVVSGMSRSSVLRRVIVPNAVRLGIRNYGNEIIFVIKGTAAASLLAITELMRAANSIYFRTFDPITPLLAAGAIYLLAVFVLSRGIGGIERRLSPELRGRRNGAEVASKPRVG
jgi:His/Glu/Gln/Arg/opine family amino acid ABC transporter permease subunit